MNWTRILVIIGVLVYLAVYTYLIFDLGIQLEGLDHKLDMLERVLP